MSNGLNSSQTSTFIIFAIFDEFSNWTIPSFRIFKKLYFCFKDFYTTEIRGKMMNFLKRKIFPIDSLCQEWGYMG